MVAIVLDGILVLPKAMTRVGKRTIDFPRRKIQRVVYAINGRYFIELGKQAQEVIKRGEYWYEIADKRVVPW